MRNWIALSSGAAAAAAVALALAGGGAAGAQDGAQTIALTAVEQHCATADNGRRGDSVGDLLACRGALRGSSGRKEGRAHWTCIYLGTERAGSDCSAVVNLSGGTLQVAGVLNQIKPKSTWAVTGGTGKYGGARGTAALTQLSAARTAVVVTLLP
jgi:hypothetical protein